MTKQVRKTYIWPNSVFKFHNPFDTSLGKAKDPLINNSTLARLSFSKYEEVREAVKDNLAGRFAKDRIPEAPFVSVFDAISFESRVLIDGLLRSRTEDSSVLLSMTGGFASNSDLLFLLRELIYSRVLFSGDHNFSTYMYSFRVPVNDFFPSCSFVSSSVNITYKHSNLPKLMEEGYALFIPALEHVGSPQVIARMLVNNIPKMEVEVQEYDYEPDEDYWRAVRRDWEQSGSDLAHTRFPYEDYICPGSSIAIPRKKKTRVLQEDWDTVKRILNLNRPILPLILEEIRKLSEEIFDNISWRVK